MRVFVYKTGDDEVSHGERAKMISHGWRQTARSSRLVLSPSPRRAPATHRHARDSAGRLGAGRGGMNGNKEGGASREDGRGRNGSRGQSVVGLWAAGGEEGPV